MYDSGYSAGRGIPPVTRSAIAPAARTEILVLIPSIAAAAAAAIATGSRPVAVPVIQITPIEAANAALESLSVEWTSEMKPPSRRTAVPRELRDAAAEAEARNADAADIPPEPLKRAHPAA